MPASALLLVLFAALCHTTWNLLLKRGSDRLETQTGALTWAVLLASPVLLIYWPGDVPAGGWLLIVASAVFETGYVFALTAAYGAGDLSLVYPVARGSAAIIVVPVAIAALGERPSASGLAGIALVLAGVFAGDARAFRRGAAVPGGRRALALALLTGSMTAGYSLVNKVGVGKMPVPLYAYLVFAVNVALVLGVMWAWRRRLPVIMLGAGAGRIVAMSALMLAAYVSVLSAMARAPVSYVVAAREVGVVVAALAGMVVLGEPRSPTRLGAAVVIFAGLVVIALSR